MENKKNNITELVFILDRSGSMAGFESDTIGGFNATIEKQRKQGGKVLVSTVIFDHVSEVIHDRIDINEVRPMTDAEYVVRGSTALFDAVGGAIHHIGNVHKYARQEDVPEHTIFIITTDGMENSSHIYSRGRVRDMIKRQTEKHGWEFVFLAANIDAEETAEEIGIRKERAVNYKQDPIGVKVSYETMCEAITAVRCGSVETGEWRRKLDNDNKRRGKR
jgi:uncharacterized protein YegL